MNGSGTTNPAHGTHTYPTAQRSPVQATPNTNWAFDHWVLDGNVQANMNPVPITMGRNRDVKAVFIPESTASPTTTTIKTTATPTPVPSSAHVNGASMPQMAVYGIVVVVVVVAIIAVMLMLRKRKSKS